MRLISSFGKFLLACVLLLGLPKLSSAQTSPDTSRKVIQFSGMLVDADSLTPLPFVAIVIRHTERGVYSNWNGYYSLVAQERDTIDFYSLGYKRASFVLPDTFSTNQYTHIQALRPDTIVLQQAVIYPWPTKEQFKAAFLSANIPNDDLARAQNNLSQAQMALVSKYVVNDAGMAYNASMQQQVSRNYYAGQAPPNNLLNPVAWSRFIQAVQNGSLKRQ